MLVITLLSFPNNNEAIHRHSPSRAHYKCTSCCGSGCTAANNNIAANTNINANNNAAVSSNINMDNVVKIDNDFLLQLLALKSIAMNMNGNNVLQQLLLIYAMFHNNDKLRVLFNGINIASTNIGLYYDATTQNFSLVDLNTNAFTDINTLISRLQFNNNQNINAQVKPSGLIDQLPIVGPLAGSLLGGLPIVGGLVQGLGN